MAGFGGMGMPGRKDGYKRTDEKHNRDEKHDRDEKVTGKIHGRKLTKKLVAYALPYWYLLALSLLIILAISAAGLIRPYLIKVAIDDYMTGAVKGLLSPKEAENGIKLLGIIFFFLIAGEFVFGYLQNYLLQQTGKKIVMNLRNKVFTHIQRLPVSYFDKNPVGRILTRVTNDTEALNEMYTTVMVNFLKDIFLMAGIIIAMFTMSLRLTLISFIVLPPIAVVAVIFRINARRVFSEIRTKLATINAFLSEHISGMKIIQAFNMQDKKKHEFDDINQQYYKARYKQVVIFGIFRPFMDIVNSLVLAVLLWYGGLNILEGSLGFGTLYIFINYINQFFHPVMELTEQYNTLQGAIVSADRIFNLLDQPLEPEPASPPAAPDMIRGEIEFKNVWFAYVGENWVLKDVSFKILPGQSVAFVGATGAGKTSIINLICGFYEIQHGEILIDGINIKNLNKETLRRHIGLVLQDVFLFSGDIKTNIRLFNKDITLQQVKAAAETVHADAFINDLPEGYDHLLNEKGTTLSAGQRQLLSFARALICDPAILVMDEATSSIDTETEIVIQEALATMMEGRTTIAIAHRLSTIQKADNIIVLHKGKIREQGTHQELLNQQGLYYNLYQLQYKDELDEKAIFA